MSKKFLGYLAGIIAGIAYGLNPLFGLPLLNVLHLSVSTVLFFRYLIAVVILGIFLLFRRTSFRFTGLQLPVLILLGMLFASSSIGLFEAYQFIPSGIATTIVFLYPVLVALIMIFLKVRPTWQIWLAIALTFIGVLFFCQPVPGAVYHWPGFLLSFISALSYAVFIVILSHSSRIKNLSGTLITFYSLFFGSCSFLVYGLFRGMEFSLPNAAWPNIIGLAILPTIVSTAGLAISSRYVGPAKASVLGVLEPVTAIIIGLLAFGEQLNADIVIGLILTLGAITFMTITDKSKGGI